MFSVSEVPRGALVGGWCGAQGVPSCVASAVRFEVGLNKARQCLVRVVLRRVGQVNEHQAASPLRGWSEV